jgi:hypothetical protein
MRATILGLTVAGMCGLMATASAQTTPPAAMPPAAAPATPPPAAAPSSRIRGTIAKVGPHSMTVTTREGTTVEIALADALTVTTVKRVPLSSIGNNTYVGIASRKDAKGEVQALEVLVFPEAMRGAGAGNYAWDLQPGSMMTNAPVTGVATQKAGRELTLTYKDGSVTIHVPLRTPVVTFVPADRADLKPGRKVFFSAVKGADGSLSASRVIVGTHGVNPPM